MMRIQCPGCSRVIEVEEELAGTVVECIRCDQRSVVPHPDPPASPEPARRSRRAAGPAEVSQVGGRWRRLFGLLGAVFGLLTGLASAGEQEGTPAYRIGWVMGSVLFWGMAGLLFGYVWDRAFPRPGRE